MLDPSNWVDSDWLESANWRVLGEIWGVKMTGPLRIGVRLANRMKRRIKKRKTTEAAIPASKPKTMPRIIRRMLAVLEVLGIFDGGEGVGDWEKMGSEWRGWERVVSGLWKRRKATRRRRRAWRAGIFLGFWFSMKGARIGGEGETPKARRSKPKIGFF